MERMHVKTYANRCHDFTPSQGIPARMTYGSPGRRLPYTITASAKTVTPGRWFMEGTDEESTERHRSMPDSHGVARIGTEPETISRPNGGKDIVLPCFDDVGKGLCHRTVFARWRQEKTGEEVKGLQKGLEAAQNGLFQ